MDDVEKRLTIFEIKNAQLEADVASLKKEIEENKKFRQKLEMGHKAIVWASVGVGGLLMFLLTVWTQVKGSLK